MEWGEAWPVIGILLTGLFGLGGVILGRRLEASALQQREKERRENDRLVAARLIKEELRAAEAALSHAISNGAWWWEDISTEWWGQHGGALAGLLTNSEWDVLVSAYHEIAADDRTRRRGVPLSDARRDLGPSREALRAAVSVLDRYTGVSDEQLPAGEIAALEAMKLAGAPAVPPGGENA